MPPPAVPCTFSSFNFSCSSFIFFCIFCICFIICCIFPPPRIYLSSLKTSISSDCNSSFVSLYMPFNSLSCITLHQLHLLCFLQIEIGRASCRERVYDLVSVELVEHTNNVSICSYFFFFSSRRRHTRSKRDWSSDVCSSDLICCIFPPPRIYLSSLKTSISSDCNSSFVSLYMPFNSLSCITLHQLHLLCFLQI